MLQILSIHRHLLLIVALALIPAAASLSAEPVVAPAKPMSTQVVHTAPPDTRAPGLEALRAAKLRGGTDVAAQRGPGTSAPGPVVRVDRGLAAIGEPGGPDPLVFDQLVSSPAWDSGAPNIASAADGTLYAIADDLGGAFIDLYRSTNDGYTWTYDYSISASGDLRNPSIAVGEGNTRRLLIAFEDGSGTADAAIRLWWEDLDGGGYGAVTLTAEPYATLSSPRICVDSPEYAFWYPYVTWTRTIVGRGDTSQIQFSRSLDYGVTFQAPTTLAGPIATNTAADIDFGGSTLYVVYTRELGVNDRHVYLRRSSNFGGSFDAEVGIATTPNDEFDPRVAATADGSLTAIAFTKQYSGNNTDIESYVTTDGSVWMLRYLPWNNLPEGPVDLAAGISTIHAVYARPPELRSSWIRADSPGLAWSQGRTVNEGASVAAGHAPAIAANPSRAQEAAMVWTTQAADEMRVYFDADYPVGDYLLVLADPSLVAAVQTFKSWKESIGYSVSVTTVEQIFEQFASGDDAERIRAYLSAHAGDVRHVLLVGDVDLLPMRMLYPSDDRPAYGTDFYYANVSTSGWDIDGDDRWGEFVDDALDYHPDLIVGRLPFDDATRVSAFGNNVAAFEQAQGSWKRDVLFAHGFYDHETRPQGIGTDCAYASEAIYTDLLQPLGWGRTRQYEEGGIHTTAFTSDQALAQPAFRSQLGWGTHGIVSAMAHGNRTAIASKQWIADFDESFTYSLPEEYVDNWYSNWNNIAADPATGLVGLFGCSTAALLGTDPCFAASPLRSHYFIRATQPSMMMKEYLANGAGAVIASTAGTDYGPGWTDPANGFEQTFAYDFFQALTTGLERAGDAMHAASVKFVDDHELRRGIRVFQCFGDPTLTVADLDVPGGLPRLATGLVSAPRPAESTARGGGCGPSSVDWSKLGELGGAAVVAGIHGDDSELLAAAMATDGASANQGAVYRSLDAGLTWTRHDVPSAWSLRDVVRTSSGRLVAVGSSMSAGALSGRIYTSDDDGAGWTSRLDITDALITDVVERANGDLVAVAALNGRVYRSADNGSTWTETASFGDGASIATVTEISGRLYVALDVPGAHAPVQRSFDAAIWEPTVGLTNVTSAYDVVRGWDGAYYAGARLSDGEGGVYRSSDEGLSWSATTELPDPDVTAIMSLVVGPDGTLYAGASTGWGPSSTRIYAQALGQITWQRLGADIDLATNVRALAVAGEAVYAGTGDVYGDVVVLAHGVTVATPDAAPPAFALAANVPNPFASRTAISYSLSTPARVTLRVFDARGRLVRDLVVDRLQTAGAHGATWDARDTAGHVAPAGVYFYRLDAGGEALTGRMVLAR